MPTYDYQCKQCGYTFETFQSMKDDALKVCPKCGQESLKRLIGTGAGVIFQGNGFYETDYKKKAPEKAASSEPS
ncbi:MAG: zinc ribbon domain-containing protein [Opitutales bacterium]|nr:zinc ribbon domain-containing protein [Opitutales bacterium]